MGADNRKYLSRDDLRVDEDSPVFNKEIRKGISAIIKNNLYLEIQNRGLSLMEFSALSDTTYSNVWTTFNKETEHMLSFDSYIKFCYALDMPMTYFFPQEDAGKKTNGNRFDELTKELDVESVNYLLNMVLNYVAEYKRLRDGKKE